MSSGVQTDGQIKIINARAQNHRRGGGSLRLHGVTRIGSSSTSGTCDWQPVRPEGGGIRAGCGGGAQGERNEKPMRTSENGEKNWNHRVRDQNTQERAGAIKRRNKRIVTKKDNPTNIEQDDSHQIVGEDENEINI